MEYTRNYFWIAAVITKLGSVMFSPPCDYREDALDYALDILDREDGVFACVQQARED